MCVSSCPNKYFSYLQLQSPTVSANDFRDAVGIITMFISCVAGADWTKQLMWILGDVVIVLHRWRKQEHDHIICGAPKSGPATEVRVVYG